MIAPVTPEKKDDKFRVTFILPASYTIDTAPKATNDDVNVVAEPETRAAVVKYSGTWSKANYDKKLTELKDWMTSGGLTATGDPVWARYDPPFSIPMFRRNEILIPIESPENLSGR